MKKKILGIFVCMLLIITAIPVVGIINDKENPASLEVLGNSFNSQSIHATITSASRGGMFIQLPPNDPDDWVSFFSDPDEGWKAYDDFWEVTSPICDIHWWGGGAFWNGTTWLPCDPEGMTFNITFYQDDSGIPGAVVCSYVDVAPTIIGTGMTGVNADGITWEKYYFKYDLNPCCDLSNGWVSIFKTYSPNDCIFVWSDSFDGNSKCYSQNLDDSHFYAQWYDIAFVLTDGEPANPDLVCDGRLNWEKIKPEENVTGSFTVINNGDVDSVLQWRIEKSSIPSWGSNWTFIPAFNFQTPAMGEITVNVSAVAPPDKNGEFTGKIKVVNVMDSTDYFEIDVVLKTPKNKAFIFNFPVLNWLFERFPNAFPILRYMMGL